MKEADLLQRSFLSNYLEYTAWTESPDSYHIWAASSLVGAVTERKVFYDQVYYKTYPNLYTCLVSASAISRKSSAMNFAIDLLEHAYEEGLPQTELLKGKMTPAAIIEALGSKKDHSEYYSISSLFTQADELSVFLSQDMKNMGLVDLLTSMYTCPDTFHYKTKSAGKFTLTNNFFNILAGTTPVDLLQNVGESLEAGFIGRFTFCLEGGRRQAVPRIKEVADVKKAKQLKKVLGIQLREIGEKDGEFDFSKDAGIWYDEWYTNLPKKAEEEESITTSKLTGFLGRKGDHAIKMAMILAMAKEPLRKQGFVISLEDIKGAADLVNFADESMQRIFAHAGKGDIFSQQAEVELFIRDRKRVSKTLLSNKFYKKIENRNMVNIMSSLHSARIIIPIPSGRHTYYYYVRDGLRDMDLDTIVEKVQEEYEEV